MVAPQRMEARRPVITGDHSLAVDQERRGLDAEGSNNDGREAVGPVMAIAASSSVMVMAIIEHDVELDRGTRLVGAASQSAASSATPRCTT